LIRNDFDTLALAVCQCAKLLKKIGVISLINQAINNVKLRRGSASFLRSSGQ
jgi:hypothetical protein